MNTCSDCDHVKGDYCTFVEEYCREVDKKSECPRWSE